MGCSVGPAAIKQKDKYFNNYSARHYHFNISVNFRFYPYRTAQAVSECICVCVCECVYGIMLMVRHA